MVIYRMICLNFLQTETKISSHYVKLTGLSFSFKFKKMRPRYVKQAANTRHQISSGQTVKNLETVIWIIPVASLCCVIQRDEVLNSTPLSQRSDTPFHIIVPEAIFISSSTTFSVTGCDLHVIAMRIHIKSQSVWCFVRWDIRTMWTYMLATVIKVLEIFGYLAWIWADLSRLSIKHWIPCPPTAASSLCNKILSKWHSIDSTWTKTSVLCSLVLFVCTAPFDQYSTHTEHNRSDKM